MIGAGEDVAYVAGAIFAVRTRPTGSGPNQRLHVHSGTKGLGAVAARAVIGAIGVRIDRVEPARLALDWGIGADAAVGDRVLDLLDNPALLRHPFLYLRRLLRGLS